MPLLLCPQLHSKLPHPSSFHLTTVPSPPPRPAPCAQPPLPLCWASGVWAPLHPPAHCLGLEMSGVNVDYFPPGVTGEEAAGEAAGTVARNILALALSWRPVESLCPHCL